jgi:penicillin-binding protein 1C
LVGVHAAAPILFDIFQILNTGSRWFEKPYDDLQLMRVCAQSAHLASPSCAETVERYEPSVGERSKICPYHQRVHLSKDGQHRVHSDCEAPSNMVAASYFVLPPTESWFYRRQQPNYKLLPPYRPDCAASLSQKNKELALVYPNGPVKIYVPINLDETQSRTVFEAKHHQPTMQLFWHLDNSYIGSTQEIHTIELNPSPGPHVITVVDEQGRSVRQAFDVIASEQE